MRRVRSHHISNENVFQLLIQTLQSCTRDLLYDQVRGAVNEVTVKRGQIEK